MSASAMRPRERHMAEVTLVEALNLALARAMEEGHNERSIHLGAPNKTKPAGHGLVLFFVEMFATRRTKRKVVTPAAVPQIARADAQSQLPLTLGAPAHFSYHRCRPSKSVASRFTCRRLLVGTTSAVVREVRVKPS